MANLPPEYRADKSLTRYKDLPDFVRGHKELEKAVGQSLRVPGADATEEERSAFYTKLGRPESPEKYEIRFTEGTQIDDGLLAGYRGAAHRVGLTSQQAQSLAEWWAEQASAQSQIQNGKTEGQLKEWDQELTTAWGWAKERNSALANRAYNMATADLDFKPQLDQLLDSTGLGNHPLMIRFFHNLALKNGEDKLVMADAGPTADDRQTAREQINAIRGDPNHPHNLPKHPGHKDAIAHMKALYEILYAKEEK